MIQQKQILERSILKYLNFERSFWAKFIDRVIFVEILAKCS